MIRARAQRRAVHHGCIELGIAVAVEHTAHAGIEDWRIFEHAHGRLNRLERTAALREHLPARS